MRAMTEQERTSFQAFADRLNEDSKYAVWTAQELFADAQRERMFERYAAGMATDADLRSVGLVNVLAGVSR